MIALADCVAHLDVFLATAQMPDYDRALNGLQLSNSGTVSRIAAAVDFSQASVARAVEAEADLLIVHHGMFWGAPQAIVGAQYDRLRHALGNNLAVYSSHLPLDLHPRVGNNTLLARQLGLVPTGSFGRYKTVEIGVRGEADLRTEDLLARVRAFAQPLGTHVVSTTVLPNRRTRAWAIVTGAGASSDTLREAQERGIDTLIVGEGPHHSAVDAEERGITVIYAGHYATETLGVQALAAELATAFSLPWTFVHLPTGL